ncbi:MAG: hypothetical protein ACLSAH_12605 [Bilophila wadsworthia]
MDAFFMSDGATFLGFAFFMNGTHGEMTRFSGNANPMRGGNARPNGRDREAAPFSFCRSLLKHESRNITDISFFMMVLFFMTRCLSYFLLVSLF